MVALRGRRRDFVEYYLGVSRGNATDAARRCEYKHPMQEGCRLLKDERVKAVIEAHLEALGVTRERVLARLAEQAFSDLTEFLEFRPGEKGQQVELRLVREEGASGGWRLAGEGHLLKSVSFSRVHGVRVELQDQQRALFQLGRYLGLWSGREAEEDDRLSDLAEAVMASARAARGGV